MSRPGPGWRDRSNRWLLALGWRLGPGLGRRRRDGLARLGAELFLRAGGPPVAQLRHHLTLLTGAPATDDLVRAGLRSYARTWTEVLALPGWDAATVVSQVVTDPVGESLLRGAVGDRAALDGAGVRGAVVALPHMANWDLVGAWACLTGLPVTTVAEQLSEAEFTAFTGMRHRLGMEVVSHRDPRVLEKLLDAVARGRVVCLMADRLMAGRGLDVGWSLPGGRRPVAMPPGPALVARRSGALLLGLACHYEGPRMRLRFSEAIRPGPGRGGLQQATQQLADFFAAEVVAHPWDWHLLQPFFSGPDRSPR